MPQSGEVHNELLYWLMSLNREPYEVHRYIMLKIIACHLSNRVSPIVYFSICAFVCLSKESNRSGVFKSAAHSQNLHLEGMVWS